jgi:hypothetical protein
LSLEDFKDAFHDSKVDVMDEDSMLDAVDMLKQLSNNRSFLAEVIHDRITQSIATGKPPELGMHTVVICRLRNHHYLRAVIWPAEKDDSYARTGGDVFYYGMPHDHNFHFLTVGYFGPGYSSDYYEVEGDTSAWYPGAHVELKSMGRRSLGLGKMMLYRAYKDVHSQLPPSATSISLNIMANRPTGTLPNQHIFDAQATRVAAIMQSRAAPAMFSTIAAVLGEASHDRLMGIAAQHPDPLTSFYALRSVALAARSDQERLDVFTQGLDHEFPLVRAWSRQYLDISNQAGAVATGL